MKNFTCPNRLSAAVLAIAWMTVGCATAPPEAPVTDLSPDPSANEVLTPLSGECPVWVYRNRTSFHALSLQLPSVYVNETRVRELPIGQTFCLNLKPGKYRVTVGDAMLSFLSDKRKGGVIVTPTPGQTVYVRYAKELGGVSILGGNAFVNGRSDLTVVTKEFWEQRK